MSVNIVTDIWFGVCLIIEESVWCEKWLYTSWAIETLCCTLERTVPNVCLGHWLINTWTKQESKARKREKWGGIVEGTVSETGAHLALAEVQMAFSACPLASVSGLPSIQPFHRHTGWVSLHALEWVVIAFMSVCVCSFELVWCVLPIQTPWVRVSLSQSLH